MHAEQTVIRRYGPLPGLQEQLEDARAPKATGTKYRSIFSMPDSRDNLVLLADVANLLASGLGFTKRDPLRLDEFGRGFLTIIADFAKANPDERRELLAAARRRFEEMAQSLAWSESERPIPKDAVSNFLKREGLMMSDKSRAKLAGELFDAAVQQCATENQIAYHEAFDRIRVEQPQLARLYAADGRVAAQRKRAAPPKIEDPGGKVDRLVKGVMRSRGCDYIEALEHARQVPENRLLFEAYAMS